jgi:hypothetical protein
MNKVQQAGGKYWCFLEWSRQLAFGMTPILPLCYSYIFCIGCHQFQTIAFPQIVGPEGGGPEAKPPKG